MRNLLNKIVIFYVVYSMINNSKPISMEKHAYISFTVSVYVYKELNFDFIIY